MKTFSPEHITWVLDQLTFILDHWGKENFPTEELGLWETFLPRDFHFYPEGLIVTLCEDTIDNPEEPPSLDFWPLNESLCLEGISRYPAFIIREPYLEEKAFEARVHDLLLQTLDAYQAFDDLYGKGSKETRS